MTQHRFTSAALTELTQATLYYEERENGLGTTFLNEIEATLNRIFRIQRLGTRCPNEQGVVELIAFRLV
jgi:hypothetical protein